MSTDTNAYTFYAEEEIAKYRDKVAEILNMAGFVATGNWHSGGGIHGINVELADGSYLFSWLSGTEGDAWTVFDWNDGDGEQIATVTLQARPLNAHMTYHQGEPKHFPPASPLDMAVEIARFVSRVSGEPATFPTLRGQLLDATASIVLREYNAQVRANRSDLSDTVRNVAFCDDGYMGAWGEVQDTATAWLDAYGWYDVHMHDDPIAWPDWFMDHQDFENVLESAFGKYQQRLREEIAAEDLDAAARATKSDNDDVFIEHNPNVLGGLPVLTVGELRRFIEDIPDDYHVTIATNGWYDNVECVQVPNVEREDHAPCVNLFGHDYMFWTGGTYDPRQH